MRVEHRCEVCGCPAEAHHIVSRWDGGTNDSWNTLWLCRLCHWVYHDKGWAKFVELHPSLRAKVERAQEAIDGSNHLR